MMQNPCARRPRLSRNVAVHSKGGPGRSEREGCDGLTFKPRARGRRVSLCRSRVPTARRVAWSSWARVVQRAADHLGVRARAHCLLFPDPGVRFTGQRNDPPWRPYALIPTAVLCARRRRPNLLYPLLAARPPIRYVGLLATALPAVTCLQRHPY